MKIFLLRHGTTEWNAARRIQGRTDIPLDPAGKALARITGEKFAEAGIHFSHVFSSPLSRARRTAELAAPEMRVQTDPRITELGFGLYEGRAADDMLEEEGCVFRYFFRDPVLYNSKMLLLEKNESEKGYESLTALCRRTAGFLSEIIEPLVFCAAPDSNILIAGHGAMNRGLMMTIQNKKDLSSFWGKGLQKNCGVFIIDAVPEADGTVSYKTDEICHTYYDDEIISSP